MTDPTSDTPTPDAKWAEIPEYIARRYECHPVVTQVRAERHATIRAATAELAALYDELLPPSVERGQAHTALHAASLWANAALAMWEQDYAE